MMSLYGAHTSDGDMGRSRAGDMDGVRLAAQQKYAMPLAGAAMERPTPAGDRAAPEWYNYSGMIPAKYDIPTAAKERMLARAAVRDAAAEVGTDRVPRPDPIDESEVDYVQAMKRQADLVDFDRYINTLVDPKKPGNLKWLMEVYPEFVHRRVAQVHDDYDFAIRNQMIDCWGINTFEDLHFKYLVDQGKVTGPRLLHRKPVDAAYHTGWLAPYMGMTVAGAEPRPNGVRLPFASDRVSGPADRDNWVQSDAGQPLAGNRSFHQMAREMMAQPPNTAAAA